MPLFCSGVFRRPGEQLFGRGHPGGIPTAANGLHKLDAGGHLLDLKIHEGLPIGQIGGLSDDHVKVAVNAQFVSTHGQS